MKSPVVKNKYEKCVPRNLPPPPGHPASLPSLCQTNSKLCENTKNYKYAYPGSNKVVNGAFEQESEEKN